MRKLPAPPLHPPLPSAPNHLTRFCLHFARTPTSPNPDATHLNRQSKMITSLNKNWAILSPNKNFYVCASIKKFRKFK